MLERKEITYIAEKTFYISLPKVDVKGLSAKEIAAYPCSPDITDEDRALLNDRLFSEREEHSETIRKHIPTLEKILGSDMPEINLRRREVTNEKFFIRDLALTIAHKSEKVRDYPDLDSATKDEIINASDQYIACRNALTVLNYPLIWYYLDIKELKFQADDTRFNDFLQQGVIGLMDAIDRYDPQLGSLSTYAMTCIHSNMIDGFKSCKFFSSSRRTSYHIHQAILTYFQQKTATNAEDIDKIAETLGMEKQVVETYLKTNRGAISLSLQVGTTEDKTELHNILKSPYKTPEESAIAKESQQEINRVISKDLPSLMECLDERERFIIIAHHVHNLTYEQIANILSLTKQRAEQIQLSAIEKLLRATARNSEISNRISNLMFGGEQIPNIKQMKDAEFKKIKNKGSLLRKEKKNNSDNPSSQAEKS